MSFRQVFRHRDFALMWTQRLIANTALMVQSVAIGWQVYTIARQTRGIEESSFLIGMIGLAQFLPIFICSLFAGAVVDQHKRRTIMAFSIGGQILCTALLTLLALQPHPSLAPLFFLAAAMNVIRAFAMPASMALVPTLVPADVLSKAIAWSSISMLFGKIVGPWLGGALCAMSVFAAYAVSTIGFALAWFCILLMRSDAKPQRKTGSHPEMVREGLAYLWSNKILFGAISLDLLAVFFGGATALLPVYARDILQVGAPGFGLLRSAASIGGLITLGMLAFKPISRHAGPWMLGAVAIFGLATIVFAISGQFWISMLMLVVLGAADSISVFIRQTLVQIVTPDQFRGRVSAVASMFISASNDLGEFESGVAARLLGPIGSVIFGGVGSLIITGLWAKLFPNLRKADRLEMPEL